MLSRFERFSYALFDISRSWHKIAAEEMESYGLKGPHCIYLITLHRHPEGITATALGELCCKDKADVSRMMSIMQEKGLVTKEGNHYRGLLRLTKAGRDAARKVAIRASKAVDMGGDGLTDVDREVFYAALERIATNLRTVSESGL